MIFMGNLFKILTFVLFVTGFIIARGNGINSNKSAVNIKINQYYFDVALDDSDLLYKKRSHKRRKIKRKPRRGRDNR